MMAYLYDVVYEEQKNELERLHDILLEFVPEDFDLTPERIKEVFYFLPTSIMYDIHAWGVDTEVGDQIYRYLKNNKTALNDLLGGQ